jgi:AraC-like DNA-binding protein
LDKIVGRGDTLVDRLDFTGSNNGKPAWYLYSRKAVEVAGERVFLGFSRRLNHFAGSNRIYSRLAQATDLITKRLSENIDVEDVASRCHCSSSQLERDFARIFHLSPKNYQTRLRIQIAKDRLRQGVALSDIATECGFSDQSSLGRAFKKNTGITPTRYKSENALV